MWKNYSMDYIKNNRASGLSIVVGVFIATLVLSFLCSLFYNAWRDDIAGIIEKEGDWQARIVGELNEEDIAAVNNFANIEKAVTRADLSNERETTVDLYFYDARSLLQDMNAITLVLGLDEGAVTYHYRLLAMYFIRIPGDESPRLMMPFYLAIVVIVSISMILVIHHSFAVSMNSRIHQFGIFSSIGATPGQIRTCLMHETVTLALVPVLAGTLFGIALSFGATMGMNSIAENVAGGRDARFQYHPLVFAITFLSAVITIFFSAWLPARKISRLTPLEAIRGTDELPIKKRKHSRILAALFGIEGELAGNALKAQKKALRTTSLSLTLAFLGFIWMQCFFTLSDISTKHTYFERYQDTWDVMVTVKGTGLDARWLARQVQGLPGIRSGTLYRKAELLCVIPEDWQSEELLALGGLTAVADSPVSVKDAAFLAKAPTIIMDDESFAQYCRQIGAEPRMDGLVLVNRLWDSLNSNFRYRTYIPYVKENRDLVTLQSAVHDTLSVEIPVLSYTQVLPALREEYANYGLVTCMPLSLWQALSGQLGDSEQDTYIRLLAREGAALDDLNALEDSLARLIGAGYEFESENRIQDKLSNDEIIGAYKLVLGAFCVLLAIIGVTHVFSNTLGFLRQRRREFARYMSVGVTPEGMRKMFCIEALALAGRPVLITLPVSIVVVGFMITASYLDPMEFIAVAPVIPIFVFISAVFGFVALAYYFGWQRVRKINLAEVLRDDTLL